MSEPTDFNFDGLDLQMAQRIDAVCRRFEAELRAGRQPRIDDYLVDLPHDGRPALRAELSALERELRPPDETVARPEAGPPTAPEPQTASNPSTIAQAPTIAPGPSPTCPNPGAETSSVHEEATVPPGNKPRSPHDQPTAAVLGQDPSAAPCASELRHIRYFGDYEISRELARGGMGVVFEARQVSLNRKVALKMILAGQLANHTDIKRFYTEAEAAANLDHPGIVPIYEVGQHEGQHYFSMGFVEGRSLSQRLADGPLPAREAAELVRRVSEAIEYAHQRGVIHRDLKPANILLDSNGNPRVTDFGLAKKIQGDSGLTGSGQIMGTPSYMPPEQAGGKRGDVGPAADVYSLGATLYALVTGRPPFQAATPMDTVIQVISDEPVPPRRLNASIPRDLETICLKCLEKVPRRRYGSARALAEELNRFLSGEPIVARPVGAAERAVKWVRRRPVIAALSAAVVVIGFLGLSGIVWQWRAAVQARNDAQDREQDAIEAQANERVQTKLAKEQTELAKQRLRETQKAQAEEKKQTELAEQRLYDVRMNLVQHYWEGSNGELLQQGLDEYLPAQHGGIDRRGFEWFYWQRKMSSGHITLKGHTDSVTSVAFSPDGQRLASASRDGTVKVWDAKAGQETLTLKADGDCVAFSPDGNRLASGGGDGMVKVWNAATGKGIVTFSAHTGQVNGVAFSPDGRRLASAGGPFDEPGEVKLWDAATGQATLTLKRHTGQVNGVAFSPDGKRLASASLDKTVIVWDATTGREIHTLKGHTDGVLAVAFSPDGDRLASASGDMTVKVWNTATGQEIRTLEGHTGWVTSVAFSPDGKWLASASQDHMVKLWDAATGRVIPALKGHNGAVSSVAFSPDGKRLASAGFNDQTVKVWDTGIGQESLTLKGHTDAVLGLALSPDGKRLASAGADGTVRVWDDATGQETLTLKGHAGFVTNVAFSPDGRRLASASPADETVRVWDAATGLEIRNPQRHILGGYVAFSPDGKRLASASADQTIKLWDAETGNEAITLKGHVGSAYGVAFSPDGKRLASAGALDDMVRVWNVATGQETLKLKGHTGPVSSVAFSPDGKRLASASLDRTLKVWDAATGQETLKLKGHTGAVTSVAFSPDGKRLASASADQTMKVWDTATGLETLTLKGHTGIVSGVAFSPDGNRLASAGGDRTLKVWDARPIDVVNTGPSMDEALHKLRMALTGEPLNPTAADHLKNLGFEAGLGGWETDVHGARPLIEFDANVVREGRQSLRVTATEPSDTAFGQEVMLKPRQAYRLLGWVRTRGLDPHGSPVFGTFQIQHTKGHDPCLIATGTNHGKDTEWSEVAITFQAPAGGRTRICVFFVGFGKGTGTAWFDNLQLVEVNASPR